MALVIPLRMAYTTLGTMKALRKCNCFRLLAPCHPYLGSEVWMDKGRRTERDPGSIRIGYSIWKPQQLRTTEFMYVAIHRRLTRELYSLWPLRNLTDSWQNGHLIPWLQDHRAGRKRRRWIIGWLKVSAWRCCILIPLTFHWLKQIMCPRLNQGGNRLGYHSMDWRYRDRSNTGTWTEQKSIYNKK